MKKKKKKRMRRMTLAESINEVYYQHYKTALTIVIVKAIIIKKYWADPILTILYKDTEINAEN